MKKFLLSAALLATAALTAPANAAVFIGLQHASVGGGAVQQVATGATSALYNGAFAGFEVNILSALKGVAPLLLDSTLHDANNAGASNAGTLDVWMTVKDFAGPVSNAFLSGFTSNILTTGWTVTATSYVDGSNGVFGGTQLSTKTFTSIGSFSEVKSFAGDKTGPYSVTLRYSITAPTRGSATTTMAITAVPEPATWAMMIGGFGLLGAASRRSRRATTVLA